MLCTRRDFYIRLTYVARIKVVRIPGSRIVGNSLCTVGGKEFHPSKTRIGSGRTPELPGSYAEKWAYAIGAGITAAAGTRLALQPILVKGSKL